MIKSLKFYKNLIISNCDFLQLLSVNNFTTLLYFNEQCFCSLKFSMCFPGDLVSERSLGSLFKVYNNHGRLQVFIQEGVKLYHDYDIEVLKIIS